MPVNAHMHLKIWLTRADGKKTGTAGQELLGQGRVELLRRMAELGSLKKAAESMGMSYRLAWGRLKKMEEALGRPLVESGDNRRGGYSLTPAGEELVAAFRLWEDEVRRFALAHAPQLHNIALEADAPAEADADARDDAPSGASALRD